MILEGNIQTLNSLKREDINYNFKLEKELNDIIQKLNNAKTLASAIPSYKNMEYIEGNLMVAKTKLDGILEAINTIDFEKHVFDNEYNHVKIIKQELV